MKRQSKLTSREQEEQVHTQQSAQAMREFATPEDLLRHDARHTPVPPTVAGRLQRSIGSAPAQRRAWWRRWFGS